MASGTTISVPAYAHCASVHLTNVDNSPCITLKHVYNGTANDINVSNMAVVGDVLIYIKPLSGQSATTYPCLVFRSGTKVILSDAVSNDAHFVDLRLTDVILPTTFNYLQ